MVVPYLSLQMVIDLRELLHMHRYSMGHRCGQEIRLTAWHIRPGSCDVVVGQITWLEACGIMSWVEGCCCWWLAGTGNSMHVRSWLHWHARGCFLFCSVKFDFLGLIDEFVWFSATYEPMVHMDYVAGVQWDLLWEGPNSMHNSDVSYGRPGYLRGLRQNKKRDIRREESELICTRAIRFPAVVTFM